MFVEMRKIVAKTKANYPIIPTSDEIFMPYICASQKKAMPLLEKQLIVKRSTLKGAGKGLFTTKDIPKGKKIVEYKGRIVKWKEVDSRDGLNGYIYYVNRNH